MEEMAIPSVQMEYKNALLEKLISNILSNPDSQYQIIILRVALAKYNIYSIISSTPLYLNHGDGQVVTVDELMY